MIQIIIWLIAGITTLSIQDKKILKFDFVVTWLVLMVHLICDYIH